MADSIDNIEDFESLLSDKNTRQPFSIYGNEKQEKYIVNKTVPSYSANDIISNVTSALKALQSADCVKNDKTARMKLEKYKKSSFLPVTLLPVPTEEPKPSTSSNKFETQCVSDTQLIDMVTNAEAIININSHKGINQEFETTFFEAPANMISIVDETEVNLPDVMKSDLNAAQIEYSDLKEGINNSVTEKNHSENDNLSKISQDIINTPLMLSSETHSQDEGNYKMMINNKLTNQCITSNIIGDIEEKNDTTTSSQVFNESIEIETHCEAVVTEEIERPTSPVFKIQTKKPKTSQHLVVSLDAFERFEKNAVSILSYNDVVDINVANHIINSQIFGNELLIQPKSDIQILDGRPCSPVLIKQQCIRNIHKDQCIDLNKNNCSEVEENFNLKINEGFAKDGRSCHSSMSSASEILKDELLFSSDEEADYVHKDVQDLPFTCALETSFYGNQSDILDKTMFVGFQTANNKSIQISTNSFDMAKSVFEDIEKRTLNEVPISLTELVEQCDNQMGGICAENEHKKEKKRQVTENIGFRTVSLSDNDIVKTNTIFQDLGTHAMVKRTRVINKTIDPDICEKNNVILGFKTASNTGIKLSDRAMSSVKYIFRDFDLNENFHPNSPIEPYCKVTSQQNLIKMNIPSEKSMKIEGFESASNENINISVNTFQNSRKAFEDDGNLKNIDITENIKLFQKRQQASNSDDQSQLLQKLKTASNQDKYIKECKDVLILDSNNKNVYKKIDIENYNDLLLEEFDTEVGFSCDNSKKELIKNTNGLEERGFKGFKTASNKQINISEQALFKTKAIFQDIDSVNETDNIKAMHINIEKNNEQAVCKGFKTASNKIIKISKEALVKTENVFQDSDNVLKDVISTHTSENLSKTIKPLEKSTQLDHSNMLDPKAFENGPVFSGSQTAIKKKVIICEQSLVKTENIFQDIVTQSSLAGSFDMNTVAKTNLSYQTVNKNMNEISEEASAKSELSVDKIDGNLDTIAEKKSYCFVGFQTASNKRVKISEKALKKTKHIFEGIDKDDGTTDKVDNSTNKSLSFRGFQTASNKQIIVSEEALSKTKEIFLEVLRDRLSLNEDISKCFVDETVKISEEASVETKITFHEMNEEYPTRNDTITGFVGFKTASDKKVTVSEEALARSKNIFQDFEKDDKKNDTTEFSGFQTANNKRVAISEDALVKTKKVFHDIGVLEHEPLIGIDKAKSFVGFQTASNKKVAISEQALSKTKTIFQDIDLSQKLDLKIDKPSTRLSTFSGFQTASKKKVEITDESLAKTRNIFQDIDETQDTARVNIKTKKTCFKSGNNNKIAISKDALLQSQKAINNSTEYYKLINDSNTEKELITTQVLNNFEETLNTEDFRKSPNVKKRPGSPILSCPKAKKRKSFRTPYKLKPPHETPKTIPVTVKKSENVLVFNNNYKKKKILALKDIELLEKSSDSEVNIDPYLLNLNFEDLLQFKFSGTRNNISNKEMSTEDLKTYFLESVNKNIVPDGWLDNHLILILWKLISYEIKFPKSMENACNARNVIEQLKYRYDRELYNVERPVLRKIFEKDDTSARTMVLCVVSILVDGKSVTSVTNHTSIELLVTDGWYTIKTSVDKMLTQLVCDGKIVVGCKLVVSGAEMVGCEQGVAPLEDTSAVRLKISGNSTRLARWDARLGRHGNAAIFIPWSTVRVDGGKVAKSRVLITRVYPSLYVHKYEDGSTVTRSERLEQIYQVKFEAERQTLLEKLYEEVETEVAQQESEDSDSTSQGYCSKRKSMETGSQIAKMMKRSKDPQEFRSHLSESQVHLLSEHTSRQRERLLKDIEMRMQEKLEKSRLNEARNVVSLLKIRVAGVRETGGKLDVTKGVLSIWKPSDAILEILQEGTWIDVMNVVPTAERHSELQVSAGRQSTFSRAKVNETNKIKALTKCLSRTCIEIKDIVQNPNMNTDYNEIDIVGLIYLIEPTNQEFEMESTKNHHFQNMFLTDADKNMLCVNFWGGIKKFGFENILDTGQFIACINLQKRIGNTKKNIPQYRATEFSYFTKTPKNENTRNVIDELVKKFNGIDRRKFCQDCVELKNNFNVFKHQNTENVSPYRSNNTDYNLSKNKIFIDSPLMKNTVMNRREIEDLNLTGLDFESTFKQKETQDLSPQEIERKKRVNAKIAKLKMYGEPPPLSPIHIINISKNASKSYKSPFIAKQNVPKESPKTTSTENYPPTNSATTMSAQNLPHHSTIASLPSTSSKTDEFASPVVSINRTHVRMGVNPIKLNFSNNQEEESNNVDHFAEEFDGSPPLSLD